MKRSEIRVEIEKREKELMAVLYDTVDKYISDAESANKPELVELRKTIRNDRRKHVDMLKDALEKRFNISKTTS